MDVPIAAFALGIVLIPVLVLVEAGEPIGVDAVRRIVGPLQYLAVYGIFSRSRLTTEQQRLVLNLGMGTSIAVAVIGVLQLADAPGVRAFLEAVYPPTADICAFGVCRPTSLLEHWSAFGAFALMQYTLALALGATPGVGISGRWLGLVAVANGLAVFASQTQAAIIGLAMATAIVGLHRRRLPAALGVVGAAMIVGVVLLWSEISQRFEQQLLYGGGLSTPESLLTRDRYWEEFFIPLVSEHLWTGTGTLLPTEVPSRFIRFVDSEYLGLLFRAGLLGLILLAVALAAMALAGARGRRDPRPLVRALGAVLLADVAVLAAMGLTAEYLTFRGVSQTLWMTAGVFALGTANRRGVPWAPTAEAPPQHALERGFSP